MTLRAILSRNGIRAAVVALAFIEPSVASAQAGAEAATFVLRGGTVITVDAQDRVVEAVAIRGNRIVAVGDDAEMASWIGARTEVIDLGGRAVVPGFVDAHVHVELTARSEHLILKVHSPPLASAGDVLERVQQRVAELPEGSWIVGQGTYGQPMPTREDLDEAAPRHPVVLRWSMHLQIANSMALEMSGIDRSTADPPGGRIDRDADGEPTGIFREAFDLFDIPLATDAQIRQSVHDTLRDLYLKQGVTTVYELPASQAGVRAYQDLWQQGELPVRMRLNFTAAPGHQPFADIETMLGFGVRSGFGDDWLRVGAFKVFVDGSGLAAVRYDRPDDQEFGLGRTPEELTSDVTAAHRAGWQLWLHAIGDQAQDIALDALETALDAFPRPDHRHRIEHLGNTLFDERTWERARRLGVIPVPTASFMWGVESSDDSVKRYPFASLLERGFRPAGNADSAGTQTFSLNPMFSLTRLVARTSRNGTLVSPEEAVSVLDAIRIHTAHAAYAGFEDDIKGSLEVGKLADLVVLSADPLTTAPGDLIDIVVDATMVDGEIRYRRR